ncbi:uroporphyrinogen decarboxylase family protein [Desulfosporosinus lacus]|uniref:Uroporphyrinogen decarboxylase n=1 Tax=Desulfosporosinus lacus DSM 15449 TaxID=1121420 RepID=A0A1M5ZQK8_9FIRM|nr:uroporphyrinogen decarboxylase family protein [Desulfosporosinus lacus]SHI26481.1 uroporphyrinogen decarboxylase [Desulfosporosinus lacus DSM 15449]
MGMATLTSLERMKALSNKQGLDRVPVNPSVSLHAAAISNMSAREFYLEPEKAFEAQIWAKEFYQYDSAPSYGIPEWSGWDFGGDLQIPSSPRISLPKLTRHAVENPLDLENLRIPDLETAPAFSKMHQFARLARAKGYSVSIPGGSPMGIAGTIVGLDLLLRWLHKEPELVHRVLRLATDYLLQIADQYITEFGPENCSVFSTYPLECQALVSPKIFEKFSLPYVKEICVKLKARGVKKWVFHLCGDHTRNLHLWTEEIRPEVRSTITIGHEMDIQHVARVFGENIIIGGNIPTVLLQTGTPREVLEASRGIIEKMKNHSGGYILMPACALPPLTPPINVFAMVKAVTLYGQYDN